MLGLIDSMINKGQGLLFLRTFILVGEEEKLTVVLWPSVGDIQRSTSAQDESLNWVVGRSKVRS